jgi:hypothetical protein
MNATRIPTGGPEGADLESLLRAELGGVADAVADAGSPAPTQALLARGHAARRRRTAVATAGGALVTALVLAVGFSVVSPQDRASLPSDPSPTVPTVSRDELRRWAEALPAGDISDVSRAARAGVVVWDGRAVTLPEVAGLDRYVAPFGSSSRGLLLGWFSDRAADSKDFDMQLGWLSADGERWTRVETVLVTNAVISPDGTRYAYTGRTRDAATQQVTTELAVRQVADDALVARVTVPEGRHLFGWVGGRIALGTVEGTELSTYDPQTLAEGSTITTRGPGESRYTSVAGRTLQVVTSGDCPETADTGPLSRYEAVVVPEDLVTGGFAQPVLIGCAPEDMQFVSPDGRFFVRPGDEVTVRTIATGAPVGAQGPVGWPGAGLTVVTWEPDSTHVQVVTYLDGQSGTLLRCSAVDGTCVRSSG